MNEVILAYAAGFFDGEGCVQIVKWYSKKNHRHYHRLDVNIGQKDMRPLIWLKSNFNGRIQQNPKPTGQPFAFWILTDKNAEEFLKLIRPYLILKGEQVDVALAYRATVKPKGLGNMRVTGQWGKTAFQTRSANDDELDLQRDEFRKQLQDLKVVH